MSKHVHKKISVAEDTPQMQEVLPAQPAPSSSDTTAKETVPAGGMARQPSYLEALVAQTSDAMIALDDKFHILDLNPAVTTMLGCTSEKSSWAQLRRSSALSQPQ
jgi:PAS domain-containing protein